MTNRQLIEYLQKQPPDNEPFIKTLKDFKARNETLEYIELVTLAVDSDYGDITLIVTKPV